MSIKEEKLPDPSRIPTDDPNIPPPHNDYEDPNDEQDL